MTGYSKSQQAGRGVAPRKGRPLVSKPKPEPTAAVALIPEGSSLTEREPFLARWITVQTDAVKLADARAALAAVKKRAERAPEEREAAVRLDLRIVRRLGQLPEAAPKPMGRPVGSVTTGNTSAAERTALSRARAIASIPAPVFEARLAEPKPTQAKLLVAAVVPEPTVDPSAEESARVHRIVRGPATDSWPRSFDTAMLNDKAVATISESVESWRSWCDQWDAALDAAPRLRRIR